MQSSLPLRGTDQAQTLSGVVTLPKALTTPLMPPTQLQAPFTQSLPSRRAVACQVRDCGVQVTELGKAYFARKRICPAHLTADSVLLDAASYGNEEYRFCHQCGKLEPLTQFDGLKRSCRTRLWRRRASQSHRPSRKRALQVDPDEGGIGDWEYAPDSSSRRAKQTFEAADGACIAKRRKPRASQSKRRNQQKEPFDVVDSAQLQPLGPVSFLAFAVDHSLLAAPAASADAANQQQQPTERVNKTAEIKGQSPVPVGPTPGRGVEQQHSAVPAPAAATSPDCDTTSAQTVRQQDQTPQQQQQQQAEHKDEAKPAANATGGQLQLGWVYGWDAGTDEATSTADADIDAQLLMQLELVLSGEEQQHHQQQQTVSRQPADVAGPCSTACHNAQGLVANANPAPADSGIIGPAFQHAAAATTGDQPAPHHKMELVNQLVEAWYEDAGVAVECEGIDVIAQHLQQHILDQGNSSSNNAMTGAAAVPAVIACHAAQAAGAAATAAAHSQVHMLADSPESAVQQYPIDHCQLQQQMRPSTAFGIPGHNATARPTACNTMHVNAPYPAAAMPPTAAAAQASAVERLVMLQRRVQEMSSQLAWLQNAMQKSVEGLVMMNPPVQPQMLNQQIMGLQMTGQQMMTDHVPAGMLSRQTPDQLWTQQSMQSDASVATALDHAAMAFRQSQQTGVWASGMLAGQQ